MRRISSSLLAIVLTIGVANAQAHSKTKKAEGNRNNEMAVKGADLTAEQQSRVRTINADYRKEVAELKTQGLSPEQMKTKREALHDQHTADIKAVLTQEQKSRISDSRAARKNWDRDMKHDIGRPTANGRYSRGQQGERRSEMAADLNLSADQQAKMQSIRSSYKTKIDAVQNDNALAKEQKREKLRELMKAQQEEMKSVLSTEQQSKMKGMRKDAVERKK